MTQAGTVRDVQILDSAPKGYFEEVTLEAVRRWTYQPKEIDVVGVISRLEFAIAP